MATEPHLFSPLAIRDITLKNRIAVSPMCEYSSDDGFANDWHLVHLGSRAVGGAGLVFTEASAVLEEGRISPGDLGIWKDEHIPMLKKITEFVRRQGSVAGMQLAHAGRKASAHVPWDKGGSMIPLEEGGWPTVAPSPIPFHETDRPPVEASTNEIQRIVEAFAAASKRALAAGFEVLEIHGAHGYLINEFLSPLSNRRGDRYGGSFENRARLAVEVTEAIRGAWPRSLPLFIRISASDWMDGGWTVGDSVKLAQRLKPLGVDLVDCSSGGLVPHAKIPVKPGYQVPFAQRVRSESGVLTGAVGMITEAQQADEIIRDGSADLVLLAREFLRDPYFPLHAAKKLGTRLEPPVQYQRAF